MQYLKQNGKCYECPHQTHVDKTGKKCVIDGCTDRLYLDKDGYCKLTCGEYNYVTDDKKKCMNNGPCDKFYIIGIDGKCKYD